MPENDFIFLVYPDAGEGAATAPTVEAESEAAFARIDSQLAGHGLSLANVVKLRLWYTEVSDFPAMNSVRDPLFRRVFGESFPASSGFVTGGRGGASPRLEIEVVAHGDQRGRSSDVAVRKFGELFPPMSQANSTGSSVFLAGQGGFRADGVLSGPEPRTQAANALEAISGILGYEGVAVTDLLSLTVFTTPEATAELDEVRAVLDDFFETNGIAAGSVLVTYLDCTELAFDGMNVEIDAIAVPGSAAARQSSTSGSGAPGLPAGGAAAVRTEALLAASSSAQADAKTGAQAEAGGEDADTADGIDAVLQLAIEALDAALEQVGAASVSNGIVTAWFAADGARSTVVSRVEQTYGDRFEVSVLPLPLAGGAPKIVLEILASPEG